MSCSELGLKLASAEKELEIIRRERDRFERQATNLTQKYKAVDVDLYNELQVLGAEAAGRAGGLLRVLVHLRSMMMLMMMMRTRPTLHKV